MKEEGEKRGFLERGQDLKGTLGEPGCHLSTKLKHDVKQ